MPRTQSATYGKKSITNICIHSSNNLTKIVDKHTLHIQEIN